MNYATEQIDVRKSRFRDASWFDVISELGTSIVIGGAGGIGSWLSLFLSRVLSRHHTVVIYDNDVVEEVNIGGQFYQTKAIGKYKVSMAKEAMIFYSGSTSVHAINGLYREDSFASPIMFSCFDNMAARKMMFKKWKREVISDPKGIFIDGRLLAEQFQILFVTPDRIEEYEKKYLFDDSEVEDVNCSYKQTTHFAANIAAKMVQGFTNWLAGGVSECPFYYEEIGSLFYSKSDE